MGGRGLQGGEGKKGKAEKQTVKTRRQKNEEELEEEEDKEDLEFMTCDRVGNYKLPRPKARLSLTLRLNDHLTWSLGSLALLRGRRHRFLPIFMQCFSVNMTLLG